MQMIRNLVAYIIIYARFSTEEQRRSLSIEGQVAECRRYIEKHWPEEKDNVVVLTDEALSGSLMKKRDGFNEMMRRVRNGEVKRVVVEKYERLGRTGPETEIAARKIESMSTEVWSTLELRDRFVRQLMGIVNEKRLRDDAANTLRGMRELARQGFPPGGPVPYGWIGRKIDDPLGKREEDGRLVQRTIYEIVTEEALVVRRIFKMHDEGMGIPAIAKILNNEHIPPPRGGHEGWDPTAIRSMLLNPKYKGVLRFDMRHFVLTEQETRVFKINPNEQWVEGPSKYIPPIVDAELWERVNSKFAERRGTGPRGPRPKYGLTGIIMCGTCKKPCQVASGTRKGHTYKYMRCGRAAKRGAAICTNRKYVSHDPALEALIAGVERGLFSEENISYLTRQVRKIVSEMLSGAGDDQNALKRSLSDLDRKIGKLVEFVEEHGTSDPEIAKRLRERRAERDRIKAQLAEDERAALHPRFPVDVEAKVRGLVANTAKLLNESTLDVFRLELKKHIQTAELQEDGRIRVVGTLEGLLQGTTLQCNLVAGGRSPHRTEPLPTFEFWITPKEIVA